MKYFNSFLWKRRSKYVTCFPHLSRVVKRTLLETLSFGTDMIEARFHTLQLFLKKAVVGGRRVINF